jgi:transmembrane sensor
MEENYKLARWLNDEMSAEELIEFQSEADYHLYAKIKLYSSELGTSDFDEQATLSKIMASKKNLKQEPKTIALQSNWFIRIAAVLVLGFGLYFANQTFSAQIQIAENGTQTSFSLPDNSQVLLNSGSEIQYKKWNWDNNRKLNLTGEAYFKVAKGKKFEVITSLGNVAVLGTQFNVKARNNRFDVTCFEGRVKVNYQSHEVIITKGQTIAFENSEQIISQNATTPKPLWTIHQMAFEKEKLASVFAEIEREYNITIEAKNIQSEQLFSGKIPADNIEVALQIIATSYHLKITKNNETSYTLEMTK